jgi:hypothetical protein
MVTTDMAIAVRSESGVGEGDAKHKFDISRAASRALDGGMWSILVDSMARSSIDMSVSGPESIFIEPPANSSLEYSSKAHSSWDTELIVWRFFSPIERIMVAGFNLKGFILQDDLAKCTGGGGSGAGVSSFEHAKRDRFS